MPPPRSLLSHVAFSALTCTIFYSSCATASMSHEDVFTSLTRQVPFIEPIGDNLPSIAQVTLSQWESLNASVSGRLYHNAPLAKNCFKSFDGSDTGVVPELECDLVQRGYCSENLRTNHPAGQINSQWETCQARSEGCLLDATNPTNEQATVQKCEMGSLSSFYIEVHDAEDVKAAFAFSQSTSVPLVIKNTGHDYKGRSTAPNSLELWTHMLQDMAYHENFIPSCSESAVPEPVKAVTLEAGVQWYKAYEFADKHNVTLVGGADRTVGAVGGWLQGGGHGALSNTMGLGVDRVLEFKIVTPDGELRIANKCQNKDLFFALRGGGGGTFGVVLSATILASPPVKIQATLIQFPMGLVPSPEFIKAQTSAREDSTPPAENIVDAEGRDLSLTRSLWSVLLNNSLKWAQDGWGGYVTGNSALYINPVLSNDEAKESMKPLVDWASQLRSSLTTQMQNNVTIVEGEFGTWYHFFSMFADDNSADLGTPLAIASRLVPTSSVSSPEAQSTLLEALISAEKIAPGVRFLVTTPFNYPVDAVAEAQDEFASPSVNPAWRNSIFHATTVTTWNWNTTRSDIAKKYQTATAAISELSKISNAAYLNEADVYESNWQDVFFGKNYMKLLEIKNKYDPDYLLDCWHCVGWNRESPRFSCYL